MKYRTSKRRPMYAQTVTEQADSIMDKKTSEENGKDEPARCKMQSVRVLDRPRWRNGGTLGIVDMGGNDKAHSSCWQHVFLHRCLARDYIILWLQVTIDERNHELQTTGETKTANAALELFCGHPSRKC